MHAPLRCHPYSQQAHNEMQEVKIQSLETKPRLYPVLVLGYQHVAVITAEYPENFIINSNHAFG